jgi:hypothetical protein
MNCPDGNPRGRIAAQELTAGQFVQFTNSHATAEGMKDKQPFTR